MGVALTDVIGVLESAYPPSLAEPWDTGIGLTCGDPDSEVERVLLAVDVDPATVTEAKAGGAQLLVTHHPLLFRPVQTVAASTDKGALLHTLIGGGIAHFAAHTNADRAQGGVNDALADALGLTGTVPLVPIPDGNPAEGLGRIGHVPDLMTLREFTARVARALPATAGGVRAAGDPDRPIRTVAVCGGSGSSQIEAALRAGVDVFVTSDITHHTAQEHCADPARPALIDIAHWSGEWPWLARAQAVLTETFAGSVAVAVSSVRTDAWTLNVGSDE